MSATPVHGVVLAAGRSSRMGSPKPLLRVGAETFLQHAVRCLREGDCRDVSIVINSADASVRAHALNTDATVIENPDARSEQIDSLRLALAAAPQDAAAVIVLPVDIPAVRATTVRAVVQAFRERPAPIIVPTYKGVGGHPLLLARIVFDAVLASDPPEGLRSLLSARADLVLQVHVDDPGIALDVDTPEDYAALSDE